MFYEQRDPTTPTRRTRRLAKWDQFLFKFKPDNEVFLVYNLYSDDRKNGQQSVVKNAMFEITRTITAHIGWRRGVVVSGVG